jgi:hypothetical protein
MLYEQPVFARLLGSDAHAYLNACATRDEQVRVAQEAQRQRELERQCEQEAQRQRELEQAQELAAEQQRRAEAEQQRAEEQAQSSRRFRWLTIVLALLFVGAVGAAILAVRQTRIVLMSKKMRRTDKPISLRSKHSGLNNKRYWPPPAA